MRTQVIGLAGLLALAALQPGVAAQEPGRLPGVVPLRNAGQSVTPSFEGWWQNPDGTYNMVFGYFNRNLEEAIDIPVGPENRMEPGGPDRGQPTYFTPRRAKGAFIVTVPKDFGTDKTLTWTLTSNGRTNSVPGHLDIRWKLDVFIESSAFNTPPFLRFAPDGKSAHGPMPVTVSLSGTVDAPLQLDLWAEDDGTMMGLRQTSPNPPIMVKWSKYRGPGKVTFAKSDPTVDLITGQASTTATFSEPGEYMLRVVAHDYSGEEGDGGCCWTNGMARVTVRAR